MNVLSLRGMIFCLLLCLCVSGCEARKYFDPVNIPSADPPRGGPLFRKVDTRVNDDTLIFLSLSGGGTRAAAFAHGLLMGLADHTLPAGGRRERMIDKVKVVSGVSGGAVASAYFGLYGEKGLGDFRERFLLQNVQEILNTTLPSIIFDVQFRGGGGNAPEQFAQWLDENLFFGASLGDLEESGLGPAVVVTASDVNTYIPFSFTPFSFGYLCSDIREYPLSHAVAASAAYPLAFSPLRLTSYSRACNPNVPAPVWSLDTPDNRAPGTAKALSRVLQSYASGEVRSANLLDGALVDNLGLHAFILSEFSGGSEHPYAPLTQEAAVKVRKIAFFVADAEQGGYESSRKHGFEYEPNLYHIGNSSVNTFLLSTTRSSADLMRLILRGWREGLIRYRCSLPHSEVSRIRGSLKGWDCSDLEVAMDVISMADWERAHGVEPDLIPTTLALPEWQVDMSIAAGWDGLMNSPLFRSLDPRPAPVK